MVLRIGAGRPPRRTPFSADPSSGRQLHASHNSLTLQHLVGCEQVQNFPQEILPDTENWCRDQLHSVNAVAPQEKHKDHSTSDFSGIRMKNAEMVLFVSFRLFIYPPPPKTGGIQVSNEDYFCLGDGEFLNDVIIDFYLK